MTNTPREVVRSDLVRACENIFIKVNSWGKFETSDIQRNGIYDYEEQCVDLLDFAANFERKLDRKAGLPHAVRYFLDLSVCCSILTGQCRRLLPISTIADLKLHILNSSRTNLTRQSAVPSHLR